MTEPRRFTKRQRIALWLAADGQCSLCGKPLPSAWHADHVTPYSRGGATDVLNGQALCPTCNLRKGRRMPKSELIGTATTFRGWQEEGFAKYHAQQLADFLCCASPGSGKTKFALEIARQVLNSGRAQRLVVVVPSTNLKDQWHNEALKFGIDLEPNFTNRDGVLPADFHGVCVTYAQVAMLPDLHAAMCRTPTMVIFDEVHHAGRERAWGDGLAHAFTHAVKRLSLSGTPFRDPSSPIPFLRQDGYGGYIADVSYGYGQALADGVVRNIVFPTYEGKMDWQSWDTPGESGVEYSVSFSDEIPTAEESRRLMTALDPEGDWIRTVITDADRQLLDVRRRILDSAAGLLVAMDQRHAQHIARVMASITGESPVVVTSDDPDANSKIEAFAKGDRSAARWLIAVRMVSEGVDIPRLFVGVWATNVMTELFFLQVVGRVIRFIEGITEDQTAYFYIPAIDRLIGYVESIRQIRDIAMKAEPKIVVEEDDVQAEEIDPRTYTRQLREWTMYRSEAIEDDVYITDERFTPAELARAKDIAKRLGINVGVELTALLMRRMAEIGVITEAVPLDHAPRHDATGVSRSDKRKALRKKSHNLVANYVATPASLGIPVKYDIVNSELNSLHGIQKIEEATVAQLEERIAVLNRWIDEARRVGR